MTAFPQLRAPHLRDGCIVAKPGSPPPCSWGGTVGIERSQTALNLDPAEISKVEVD
jgi:hypothetical protein